MTRFVAKRTRLRRRPVRTACADDPPQLSRGSRYTQRRGRSRRTDVQAPAGPRPPQVCPFCRAPLALSYHCSACGTGAHTPDLPADPNTGSPDRPTEGEKP